MEDFLGWNDVFFSCLSEDIAKSFPHHHEKYVLIAILGR
jgi:hypothetical protein